MNAAQVNDRMYFWSRTLTTAIALTLGLAAVVVALSLLARAGPTKAATLCVKPGGGDGCQDTIQAAIDLAMAGDTIQVAAGEYTEYVLITKTLTLQGGWAPDFSVRDLSQYTSTIKPPINLVNPDSVVWIQGQSVDTSLVAPTLDGFVLTGGRADLGSNHGGGLKIQDSDALVISNTIRDNAAFLLGGGVWVQRGAPTLQGNVIEGNTSLGLGQEAYGGGVQLENAQASLVENFIASNVVSGTEGYGGGIEINGGGPILLTDNVILSNTAVLVLNGGFGGGISTQNVDTQIVGGSLTGNLAKNHGAGLYVSGSLSITGVTISQNTASINGGGIFFNGGVGSLLISNTMLANNEAVLRGGAVHFDGVVMAGSPATPAVAAGKMSVYNSTFAGNLAGSDGGGLVMFSGDLQVSDTAFDQNLAGGGGGGLALFSSPLVIDSSTFIGNQGADGGAMDVSGDTAIIDSSLFQGNEATFNAGAIINGSVLTLTNSTIISNTAGDNAGAIENGLLMTIVGSMIAGNTAGDDAGAIQNNMDDELTISQSLIENNTAADNGGALTNSNGGVITIRASTLAGNTADSDNDAMGDGGGIYNNGTVDIIASSLSDNQAASFGGGIFNNDVFTLTQSLVEANQADDGAGIHAEGGSVTTILGSTVSGNTTIMGGGAGINNNGALLVQASTFSGNQTTSMNGNGAGILNNDQATILNSTVSGNVSLGFGGGIRNAASITLTNVTVFNNTGALGAGGVQNMDTALATNTIIAANSPDNCSDPLNTLGHNLEDADTCALNPGLNDLIGLNPLLGPLTDNGGVAESLTHALDPMSPAIDTGDNAACPAADQRGGSRPVDGDGNGSAICDIGSYEYGSIVPWLYLPLVRR